MGYVFYSLAVICSKDLYILAVDIFLWAIMLAGVCCACEDIVCIGLYEGTDVRMDVINKVENEHMTGQDRHLIF